MRMFPGEAILIISVGLIKKDIPAGDRDVSKEYVSQVFYCFGPISRISSPPCIMSECMM